MLKNTPIWYWTNDRSGEEIAVPAIYLNSTDEDDSTSDTIEILENDMELCGVLKVSPSKISRRKV